MQAVVEQCDVGGHPYGDDMEIQVEQENRKRSDTAATVERLRVLVLEIDRALQAAGPDGSKAARARISSRVAELDRLVGESIERTGRWEALRRHLWFGQRQDWGDIRAADWPTVCADVMAAIASVEE